ncbi:MAG: proline dehydrogenase family protein [Candidatus Sericytochromatia bacterium]
MDLSASATQELPLDQISFDNTEIAFASRSDADLRRAWWLFRMIGQPALVRWGKPMTRLAFGLGLPIEPLIKETLFRQFVGGESIEACESTIAGLAKYEIGSILDYSAEGKSDEANFDHTRDEILGMLERAAGDERIPFAVFKPTGLARPQLLEKASQWGSLNPEEEAELARFKARVEMICLKAVNVGTPVLIDAEESWLQPVCDRLALELMQRFNREQAWVWNTLQMYRRDRLDYLGDLLNLAVREGFQLGLKLVRGAYMEKEREHAAARGLSSPIHADKTGTDQAFDGAVNLCLEQLVHVSFCCGSHNEASNYKLMSGMESLDISRRDPRIWFAQLLGMSDHISYNLARAGYNVAKYVPYAPIRDLVPYLMRRAEENTSVAGQSSRELDLLQREMQRRKLL